VTRSHVVVVGDVVNDIIVRPTGPFEAGTDTPSEIGRSPGGSGANQAAWLAALGARVRFAARAGATDAADHRQALERHGVEAWLAEEEQLATGTIVVLVSPDGERSMFTDRGANRRLREADLPTRLLAGARLLHVSAYPLFEAASRAAVRRLWAAALDMGVPTSVDPASVAGLRQVGRRPFLEWTTGATLIFPNLDEGRLLTGSDDPPAIVASLLEHYRVVALKLGREGALVATPDGRRILVAPEPGQIVDSTGAGDAFCAGFLACWALDGDLDACSTAAAKAAAQALGQIGARPSGS